MIVNFLWWNPLCSILSLYKGQVLWSLQDHGNTILPLKEDNLCITVKLCQKLAGPKGGVSL